MVDWPTVGETDSVRIAVQLMVEQNVRFVPVVNDSGRLKGIITRARVVNFVLDYL
jgi:CBS domain-containing protein